MTPERRTEEDLLKAWRDFKKSVRKMNEGQYPNQVSVSDKMDILVSQVADIKTSVERLDNVVPEIAADQNANAEGTEETDMSADDLDSMLFGDLTDDMEEIDATDEVGDDGEVDTADPETADFTDDGEDNEAPVKDEGGEDEIETDAKLIEDAAEEESESEKKEDDEEEEIVKISKANFVKLIKMVKTLNARVGVLEKSNVRKNVAPKQFTNTPVRESTVRPKLVTKSAKPQAVAERTIRPARPPITVAKAGKQVLSSRPSQKAAYTGGATPEMMNKSVESCPIAIGMGSDPNDIAERLAKTIDAAASGRGI